MPGDLNLLLLNGQGSPVGEWNRSLPDTPRGNSGTAEPAAGPVVPLFPQPPYFRGNDIRRLSSSHVSCFLHTTSEKRGIRAGIRGSSPAGTGGVTFSDVTAIGRRGDGNSCQGRVPAGQFSGFPPAAGDPGRLKPGLSQGHELRVFKKIICCR